MKVYVLKEWKGSGINCGWFNTKVVSTLDEAESYVERWAREQKEAKEKVGDKIEQNTRSEGQKAEKGKRGRKKAEGDNR